MERGKRLMLENYLRFPTSDNEQRCSDTQLAKYGAVKAQILTDALVQSG